MPSSAILDSPVERIPDPSEIRDRLAVLARERMLLKSLLKLSQRKQEYLPRPTSPGGPAHVA